MINGINKIHPRNVFQVYTTFITWWVLHNSKELKSNSKCLLFNRYWELQNDEYIPPPLNLGFLYPNKSKTMGFNRKPWLTLYVWPSVSLLTSLSFWFLIWKNGEDPTEKKDGRTVLCMPVGFLQHLPHYDQTLHEEWYWHSKYKHLAGSTQSHHTILPPPGKTLKTNRTPHL